MSCRPHASVDGRLGHAGSKFCACNYSKHGRMQKPSGQSWSRTSEVMQRTDRRRLYDVRTSNTRTFSRIKGTPMIQKILLTTCVSVSSFPILHRRSPCFQHARTVRSATKRIRLDDNSFACQSFCHADSNVDRTVYSARPNIRHRVRALSAAL